ncbi:putative type II secretion system protein K [Litorimonas cladophorae]|uniref:Type II secretion system protein K n=1 Tax=Litorimonas cladophorae TaxID=1220491 RepID=A0A918KPA7_9PROT|nr:type II secretion system minor pseudopilin GspK [Litorimonas cladophorae]GGX69294.1 putative type II secretion system protein K [Litorimonas cladophorae]
MTRKSKSEQGTVLLTTLLIMAVMAALTVALMEDIRFAVKRTINVNAYAQADWQAGGAEDFIAAYLQNDFRELDPAAKAVLLQSRTPLILPTPEGAITLILKDASHCFNLSHVVTDAGEQNSVAAAEFSNVAQLLGLPPNQAIALASTLIDWQDKDQQMRSGGAEDGTYLRRNPPYRTADTAMRSPEEMRALNGMDEDLWELFKPFVCTGPTKGEGQQSQSININSLPPERLILLAAALAGVGSAQDAVPVAEALLRDRPMTGYETLDEITTKLEGLGFELQNPERLGIDVTAIFVEVVTQVGPAERVRTYRYDGVDTGVLQLTYRGWGRETFRPEIEIELDAR